MGTPTLGLADFEFDSNNMPVVAATGHYSVTMQFSAVTVAGTTANLSVNGNDMGTFPLPLPSGVGNSNTQITREIVCPQDDLAKTATGSLVIAVTDGAALDFAVIAPLRKTSVVDPNVTGFSPADGLGSDLGNASCAGCHPSKFEEWRSSMMGYSSISPPIHNLELTENHVNPGAERDDLRDNTSLPPPSHGRFARSPNAPNSFESEVHSQSPSSLFCQRCHAPSATYTDVTRVFDLDYSQERGSIPDNHLLLSFLVETDMAAIQGLSDTDPTTIAALGNYDALLRDLAPGDPTSGRFYQDMTNEQLDQLQVNARAGTEGVTCTVCHSINGLDGDVTPARSDNVNEEGIGNSGFRVVHLDSSDEARINFGPYTDEEFVFRGHNVGRSLGDKREGTDGLTRPFIQTGQMCGTCHDVRIGDDDYGPNGIREGFPGSDDDEFRRVENLFTEWRDSPWNNNNGAVAANISTFENPRLPSGMGDLKTSTTCQDCHMSKYVTHDGAAPGDYEMYDFGGEDRRNTNHRFVGVDRFLVHDIPRFGDTSEEELKAYDISLGRKPIDPDTGTRVLDDLGNEVEFSDFEDIPENDTRDLREILLQKAAKFNIESVGEVVGGMLPISVSVENVGVGHNLPAGLSQERQLWIELEVLDANGAHVYTSGYLNPLPESGEPMYDPAGSLRYRDSYCAQHEYECELDFFRVPEDGMIAPDLSLKPQVPGEEVQFELGLDPMLTNYQNGFALGEFDPNNKLKNKVLTQFIGDHIVNTNSLAPFEKRFEEYMIPVSKVPGEIRNGPYTVNARLRFRPLPPEFLEGLKKAFTAESGQPAPAFPSRITTAVIERNIVIEMENDGCVSGGFAETSLRACGRVDDGTVTTITAGQGHTCVNWGDDIANPAALSTDGIANRSDYVRYTQCFGDNQFGQVGAGTTGGGGADERTAVTIDLINQATLSAGDAHTCALHRGGTVSCWGAGAGGRLGDGDTSAHDITGPREIDPSVLEDVSTIASAQATTCAVTKGQSAEEDRVFCWGDGAPGELGSGGTPVSQMVSIPSQVAALESGEMLRGIEQIAAGAHHYCVIADGRKLDETGAPDFDVLGNPAYSSGHVYCWGAGPGNGQEDAGSATDVAHPAPVSLPYQATKVVAGEDFSCALLNNGDVYCWGSNEDGRLGIGDIGTPSSLSPIKIQLDEVKIYDLVAGQKHACVAETFSEDALTHNVRCWGDGENGKNGDSAGNDRPAPLAISHDYGSGVQSMGLTGVVSMAAGAEHTCLVTDGSAFGLAPAGLYCWGDNSRGQLGMTDEFAGLSVATRLTFYDKGDPSDSGDDVEGDLPDPMITGRSYYATEVRGGPGMPGCIVANSPFQQCTDEQDFIDVNGGDNFRYVVDAFGGMTELHFEISKLNGERRMEVFLNGGPTGMLIQATDGMAGRVGTQPNRTGLELPPITLDLEPGLNEIILVDNQNTAEFDMHRVRLVRTQDGTCFDDDINNGETALNCGGPFCGGCEVGEVCGQDMDCASGICEAGACSPPEEETLPPCDLSTATDMGPHGASTVVPSNACLKLTQYPSWWQPRPVKIRRDGGAVDMSFSWDNRGGGSCDPKSFGSGIYSSSVAEVIVGDGVDEHSPPPNALDESTVSGACPTLIQLEGDSSLTTIRWWAN